MIYCNYSLLTIHYSLEIALEQACKAGTMTGLVLGHLMNGVVDSIETSGLGILGNTELILAGTSLSSGALLKVRLGIPYALTQQFCET